MYNEKLEALISAALADGVLTEKEKQVLFKKAEAMGIDLDEFEMVLDARLVELKKKEAREDQQYRLEMEKAKSAQQSAPKSEKFGDVRKCPACGAMVESLMTKCPECGHEFINIEANSTTKKLMQKIDEIQAESSTMMNAIKSDNEKVAQEQRYAVEKQIRGRIDQAIQNFPIPNTKEDLIEFLTLCISNSHSNNSDAWKNKLKQVIAKAKVMLPDDEDVQSILRQYDEDTEKEKKSNIKKIVIFFVVLAVLGLGSAICGAIGEHNKNSEIEKAQTEYAQEKDEENAKTLAYVEETAKKVNQYLEEGNLTKAANELTMCRASKLGNPLQDNEEATSLYKSLVANVVDAFLDKGQKKKAQNLVISCSSKFDFGKAGLSELFKKLGSDGNYEFH